jgi:hypothetical protein
MRMTSKGPESGHGASPRHRVRAAAPRGGRALSSSPRSSRARSHGRHPNHAAGGAQAAGARLHSQRLASGGATERGCAMPQVSDHGDGVDGTIAFTCSAVAPRPPRRRTGATPRGRRCRPIAAVGLDPSAPAAVSRPPARWPAGAGLGQGHFALVGERSTNEATVLGIHVSSDERADQRLVRRLARGAPSGHSCAVEPVFSGNATRRRDLIAGTHSPCGHWAPLWQERGVFTAANDDRLAAAQRCAVSPRHGTPGRLG